MSTLNARRRYFIPFPESSTQVPGSSENSIKFKEINTIFGEINDVHCPRFPSCVICIHLLHKCSRFPRKRCTHRQVKVSWLAAMVLSAPSRPVNPRAVASCSFPASTVIRTSAEALLKPFPDFRHRRIQGKELPLTVAGQQWFFTIFPSINHEA